MVSKKIVFWIAIIGPGVEMGENMAVGGSKSRGADNHTIGPRRQPRREISNDSNLNNLHLHYNQSLAESPEGCVLI